MIKIKRRIHTYAAIIILCLVGSGLVYGAEQFIYHGTLSLGGAGTFTNGTYDLKFTVYSDPNAGVVIGNVNNAEDVPVNDNEYSTPLYFNCAVVSIISYLEVQYRDSVSTDPNDFTIYGNRTMFTSDNISPIPEP